MDDDIESEKAGHEMLYRWMGWTPSQIAQDVEERRKVQEELRKNKEDYLERVLQFPFAVANEPTINVDKICREFAIRKFITYERTHNIHDIEEIDGVFVGQCREFIFMTRRIINFYNWNANWIDCSCDEIDNARKEIVIKYFIKGVPELCTAYAVFGDNE